ncbi:hypothetical protein BGX21_006316 [Mortierella sp. AD011]|nr:hypothetical protein BGX21_006316 [Mortierella sp. AD011]
MSNLESALASMNLDDATRVHLLNAAKSDAAVAAANAATSAAANATNATTLAAHNDNIRTMTAVLKPTKPTPFDGKIDAEACLNFLEDEVQYNTIVGLHESLWVRNAVLDLKDDAKAWW